MSAENDLSSVMERTAKQMSINPRQQCSIFPLLHTVIKQCLGGSKCNGCAHLSLVACVNSPLVRGTVTWILDSSFMLCLGSILTRIGTAVPPGTMNCDLDRSMSCMVSTG